MARSSKLMSIAYLPNIAWFQHALQAKEVYIETKENYIKQSYRNRCKILSANGPLDLSIPVLHLHSKQLISEIKTQDQEAWQKKHWQAICAAYGKSAFFLYYRDKLENIFLKQTFASLFDFNLALINTLCGMLKIELQFQFTESFEPLSNEHVDYRNFFHAKGIAASKELVFEKKYDQVFAEKFPFQANLSIIDLLFNAGPLSKEFLIQKV